MANSRITLTFLREAVATDFLEIRYFKFTDQGTIIAKRETWQTGTRLSSGVIKVRDGFTKLDFITYFNIDHNTSKFDITGGANGVVVLDFKTDEYDFAQISTSTDGNGPLCSAVISNKTDRPTLNIDSWTIGQALDSFNTLFRLTINANEPFDQISHDYGATWETFTETSSHQVDKPRDLFFNIMIRNSDNTENVTQYPANNTRLKVGGLSSGNIKLLEYLRNGGSSISIQKENLDLLTIEFSIDGGDSWFDTTEIQNLPAGSYTLDVRDNIGGTRSIDLTVRAETTRDPYNYISKANSIQYVKIEATDNQSVFDTEENTFSFENRLNIAHCTRTRLQNSDSPITQVKSNFDSVAAVLRYQDGTEYPLTVTKQTDNLDTYSGYTNTYGYDYGDYTAIRFTEGYYLSSDGIPDTESPYDLSGNLPSFARIGNSVTITLDDGTLVADRTIRNVVYDPNQSSKVILVDTISNSAIDNVTELYTSSVYDLLPYNIFEFTTDFDGKAEGIYDVVVTSTDAVNGTEQYQSENIHIKAYHEDTVYIRWYNDTDGDIFYSFGLSGIGGILRAPILDIVEVNKQTNVISEGDESTVTVESDVYEQNQFMFDAVTGKYLRTLVIALSSKNVFINTIGYVKQDEIEVEKVGMTNLYSSNVVMNKSNYKYGINTEAQIIDDTFDAPNVLTTETGFIES